MMGGQMSNQRMGMGQDAAGMGDDGSGMGYGSGSGGMMGQVGQGQQMGPGFGPGGMRMGPGPMGAGPVGPGGLPPGNAAGANPNACFNCGASDHMARSCPHPKDFATQCHNCGEMGHRAKDCPKPPSQPPPPPMQRGGPGWGPGAGEGQWCAGCQGCLRATEWLSLLGTLQSCSTVSPCSCFLSEHCCNFYQAHRSCPAWQTCCCSTDLLPGDTHCWTSTGFCVQSLFPLNWPV